MYKLSSRRFKANRRQINGQIRGVWNNCSAQHSSTIRVSISISRNSLRTDPKFFPALPPNFKFLSYLPCNRLFYPRMNKLSFQIQKAVRIKIKWQIRGIWNIGSVCSSRIGQNRRGLPNRKPPRPPPNHRTEKFSKNLSKIQKELNQQPPNHKP